ncbi:Set1/Ash2 histone methyltransferase complex subunit ASH2 [Podochytrium sp. JEL0797]|nr:Set1/Ash2 histone methyltransferase complex subunit ASH2 [Podochytrium sp. JEL0797]
MSDMPSTTDPAPPEEPTGVVSGEFGARIRPAQTMPASSSGVTLPPLYGLPMMGFGMVAMAPLSGGLPSMPSGMSSMPSSMPSGMSSGVSSQGTAPTQQQLPSLTQNQNTATNQQLFYNTSQFMAIPAFYMPTHNYYPVPMQHLSQPAPRLPQLLVQQQNQPALPSQQQQLPPPSKPRTCYCGLEKPSDPIHPTLQCRKCLVHFHRECIQSFQTWTTPPLLADDFYVFHCSTCHPTQKEHIQRQSLVLSDIAHLALFQLTYQHLLPASTVWSRNPTDAHVAPTPRRSAKDDRVYFTRKQVAGFVDANWDRFWLKGRAANWSHSIMAAILAGGGGSAGTSVAELRFVTGREAFLGESSAQSLLALFNKTTQPSAIEAKRFRQAAFDILPDGTLIDLPGAPPRPVVPQVVLPVKSFSESSSVAGVGKKKDAVGKRVISESVVLRGGEDSDGESVNSNVSRLSKGAAAAAKKKFVKPKPQLRVLEPEEVDAQHSVLLYPDLHNPEFGPVILSNELTHTAPQMKISQDGLSVSTDKGYRMSKATHGVYEGCWYYEVTFHAGEKGHARVGWSQISGDLQAPCGYDKFSYSFRDTPGTLFHESRPLSGTPEPYLSGFKDGDVLGLMITLPETPDMENMVRRLWRIDSSYVQFKTKEMVKVRGSEIRYFRNGVDLGVAFRDLYNGKYHPAVSSYQHGTLSLNFGPHFQYPLPPQARPYSDVPKVFAWSDLSQYSYEPFTVYEKEFSALSQHQLQQQQQQYDYLMDSPPPANKRREFLGGGGGVKRRRLKKKSSVSVTGSPSVVVKGRVGSNVSSVGSTSLCVVATPPVVVDEVAGVVEMGEVGKVESGGVSGGVSEEEEEDDDLDAVRGESDDDGGSAGVSTGVANSVHGGE